MKPRRILIADAHPAMMEGVRLLLKERFDVALMAADAPSLRDAVESSQFDLVVVDLSMPVSPGDSVPRFLRRTNPGVRFIVLSVHDDPAVVDRCLAAGADGFVLKRTAVNDLVPAVEAVLRGDVYICPSIQTRRENAGSLAATREHEST
jgi:DNA-binding NarL/FixJ family response regulator